MIKNTLKNIFNRDLTILKQEIETYSKEKNIWRVDNNITNSGGNLCLHLIGNLNEYIGRHIGGFDFKRDREYEFTGNGVSRDALILEIENTMTIVESSLNKLTDEVLVSDYPVMVFAEKMTYEFFLIHLTTHLRYHLGQLNYHRRLLDN